MYRFQDAEVDGDHDKIISQFDRLSSEVRMGRENQDAVVALANQLLHYSSDHFDREEMLMKDAGYPEALAHREAHGAMRDEFSRVLAPMLSARLTLQDDIRVLRDMFLGHIVTWDEAYAAWLGSRSPGEPKVETTTNNQE